MRSRSYELPSSSGPDSFAAVLFIFMACLRSNASNSFAVYSFAGIGSRLVPKCGYGAFGSLSFDILHPPDLYGVENLYCSFQDCSFSVIEATFFRSTNCRFFAIPGFPLKAGGNDNAKPYYRKPVFRNLLGLASHSARSMAASSFGACKTFPVPSPLEGEGQGGGCLSLSFRGTQRCLP